MTGNQARYVVIAVEMDAPEISAYFHIRAIAVVHSSTLEMCISLSEQSCPQL